MSYTFVIKSQDKISGTNNNGTYAVNFRILPDDVQFYNATFNFYSSVGFYKDTISGGNDITYTTGNGYINTNLVFSRSMSSNSSPTNNLGTIRRQLDSIALAGHPTLTYLYADCATNCPKIILKPQIETLNISIYNSFNNSLFVDTNYNGSSFLLDMSSWVLTLTLDPIKVEVPST